MKKDKQHNSQFLTSILDTYIKKIFWVGFFRYGLAFCTIILSALAFSVFLEYHFYLKPVYKLSILIIILITILTLLVYYAKLIFKSVLDYHNSAIDLESKISPSKGYIRAVFDVNHNEDHVKPDYSQSLMKAIKKKAEAIVSEVDINTHINKVPLKKSGKIGGIVGGILLLFLIIFKQEASLSINRLAHPLTVYNAVPSIIFDVYPGNSKIVKDDSLNIIVKTNRILPEPASILIRYDNRNVWKEEGMNNKAGENLYRIKSVTKGFSYKIRSDNQYSQNYHIDLIEPPHVEKIIWNIYSPQYSKQPVRIINDNSKQVEVLKGSYITLDITSNKKLDKAWVVLQGKHIKVKGDLGRNFKTGISIFRNSEFYLELLDKDKVNNRDPVKYSVNILQDEYPTVKIVKPGSDMDMPGNMLFNLQALLWDDYGISKIELFYQINDGDWNHDKVTQYYDSSDKFNFLWKLSPINLLPGEVLTYYLKVYDNDLISGPKLAESAKFKMRYPSLDEILREADDEYQNQITQIEDSRNKSRQLSKDLSELNRELKRNPNLNWEQKQKISNILKKQNQLNNKLKSVSENMQKTMEKLKNNSLMSTEIAEKMAELQQLIREVATKQMKELMQKIQESMKKNDGRKLQQMIQNMNQTHEQFLQKLDRTLALFKKMKIEQKLEALVRKAEDLKKRQKSINENLNDKKTQKSEMESLARKQDKIKKDLEKLNNEISALANKLQNEAKESAQTLNKSSDFINKSRMSERMSKMSSMMNQSQQKESSQMGSEVKKDMDELSNMLSDARDQMQNQEKDDLLQSIGNVIRDLLYLSFEEETVHGQSFALTRRSSHYSEIAEHQQYLVEGLGPAANKIIELSQSTVLLPREVIVEISNANASMIKSISGLENKNARWATMNQKSAINSLNKTILDLKKVTKKINSMASMSQESFMQQLQAMSQKQGNINSMTNQMMQLQGKGRGLSLSQQAEMKRLGGEQQGLQKQLEKMMSGGHMNGNMANRLNKVSEDMKKVADDFLNRNVSKQTREQQRQIYNRLLDTQKSIHKREYSKEREAKSGKTINRNSPGEYYGDVNGTKDNLHQDLLKALKEDYPREYKELIRAYFHRLSEEEHEQNN